MTARRADELVARIASAMNAGDISALAECYATPMAIYLSDRTVAIASRPALLDALAAFRARLWAAGTARVAPRIAAQGLSRGDTVSLWTEWNHFHADGSAGPRSFVRYFASTLPSGRYAVQLVEYLTEARPGAINRATEPHRAAS